MSLPKDPKARKKLPVYSGLMRYFPDALAAVAEVSRIGNDQHHPGEPLHWDKSKSTDELDAAARHMLDMEESDRDDDGVLHAAKLAWRALANLQRMADGGMNVLQDEPMVRDHEWGLLWYTFYDDGTICEEINYCSKCPATRSRRRIGDGEYRIRERFVKCNAA